MTVGSVITVADVADLHELTALFRAFGQTCLPRSPLYARLGDAIADDPELVALMLAAPPEQHNPTLLLAALHDLVLRGASPELAAFYPNVTTSPSEGDPVPALRELAATHAEELREMLRTRRTQTNEVGRCATLLPVLGRLAERRGPLAMIDVGTSAGLNQRLTSYSYRYEPNDDDGTVSTVAPRSLGSHAPVKLVCGTRGPVPVPATMPDLVATVGLDSSPIDVSDDDAVRWLEACVWPDQADRFARLKAAVAIARADPPAIRVGDAVGGVVAAIESVDAAGHPVVTTTWVMNYLTADDQRAFVDALDGYGRTRDLSWITAESPALTPGLPASSGSASSGATSSDAASSDAADAQDTVVSLTAWRDGTRRVSRLAVAHPHGYWLQWQEPTAGATRPPW